jgi:predicted DNA-binding protein
MGTVSFRVPDEVKARMEEHAEINWSAVLRGYIEEELRELEERNLAHAVATSERLSSGIDPERVASANSAETVREFRDRRYGTEES